MARGTEIVYISLVRILRLDFVKIVHAYQADFVPMTELARQYGVTRMAIYKLLRRQGVDTSHAASKILTICDCCGKEIIKYRSCIRKSGHSFCNRACYHAWAKIQNLQRPVTSARTGRTLAARIIGQYFELKRGMYIEFIDGNPANQELHNLCVFASARAYVLFRSKLPGPDGKPVLPIWTGLSAQ